jgi:hypothetical protein
VKFHDERNARAQGDLCREAERLLHLDDIDRRALMDSMEGTRDRLTVALDDWQALAEPDVDALGELLQGGAAAAWTSPSAPPGRSWDETTETRCPCDSSSLRSEST